MNKKVLIIDDENSISFTMKTFFISKGLDAITPANLDEIEKLFKGHEPDLVITDYFMPNYTANDVINSVRRSSPYLPIIVMTGFKGNIHLKNDENIFLIQKPIDLEELYLKILTIFQKN